MDLQSELKEFRSHFREEVREAALKLLLENMPRITEELFGLYEKNGNRLVYERVYFARRRFLAVLGLEAMAQKEEKDSCGERKSGEEKQVLEKLASVIEDICGEECWALPPHVNRKEEGWQFTVDLFAAETAQALAELGDRLAEDLPAQTLEQIKCNVEKRVFLPFFTSQVPYRNWENGLHNWNGVCAGAVGSACIHLMKDKERLKASLTRICSGLRYYISGFEEDGACTEGLGYYTYGMGYFANFAQELYDLTKGEHDLFRGDWGEFCAKGEDKRGRIAEFERKCFFEDGRTVSFGDGNNRGRFRVGLSCILAMHYPNFTFPSLTSAAGLDTNGCYNFAELKSDLFMPKRIMNGRLEEKNHRVDILPSAQWVIARSKAGAGMACKGGHNMEFHNHNDVGHFVYEGFGIMFFTDLGAGEYKKGYFGEGRYKVFCNGSSGHSVPMVNGEEQLSGREYGCSDFMAEEGNEQVFVRMNLAGAYEKNAAESLWRSLKFDLNTGKLQVRDEICMGENGEGEMTENLVTQIRPVLEGNKVLLPQGEWTCVLTVPKGEIYVAEHEHSNHKGIKEKVYVIRWKVDLEKGRGSSEYEIGLTKREAGTVKEDSVYQIQVKGNSVTGEIHNFWNHIHFHPTDAIEDAWGRRILDQVSEDGAARYMRIYAMLEDVVSRTAEGELRYDFRETDKRIDYLVEKGFRLLICFNFLPKAIAADPECMSWLVRYKGKHINTSRPGDYREWQEVCRTYTRHLKERYGEERLAEWYFHCWNEPDFPDYFLSDTSREGHMAEVAEEYGRLYDHFAQGVTEGCSRVKIGGPSAALSNEFIERFLRHVKQGVNWADGKTGSRIDFLSLHTYGAFPKDLMNGKRIQVEDTYARVRELEGIAVKCGFEGLEMVVDEWGLSTEGFSDSEKYPVLNFRNTEYYGAAYAHMINYYVRHKAPVSMQMICLSGQHRLTREFHGYRSFFTLHGFPKPIYNAYALCAKLGDKMLEGQIRDISGDIMGDIMEGLEGSYIGVLPTVCQGGKIEILIYRFCPWAVMEEQRVRSRTARKVHLQISDIRGRYTVRHYRIDHENANAYTAWRELGGRNDLNSEETEWIRREGALKVWYPEETVEMQGRWQTDIVMTDNALSLVELEPHGDC